MVLLPVSIALAACGSTPSTSSTAATAPAKSKTLSAELPAAIRSSGELTVCSEQNFEPLEFTLPGQSQVVGFSAGLLTDVASELGLKVKWVYSPYESLLPDLNAGRCDVASGGTGPNPQRLAEANMVGYFKSGAGILVPKSSLATDKSILDFCGKSVGVVQGSTNVQAAITKDNAYCKTAHKPDISLKETLTITDGVEQLLDGRLQGYLADYPEGVYIAAHEGNGKFGMVGGDYEIVQYVYAWCVRKTNPPQLLNALSGALSELMKDGKYRAVLKSWDVVGGTMTAPVTNNALLKYLKFVAPTVSG